MANPNVVETEELLAEIVRSARTVAVVGMKGEEEPDAPAHAVAKRVQSRGLRVIPVNPKLTETLGEKAYPDLASAAAAERFDMVNVFRRSDAVGQVADQVLALPKERRPDVVWLQTGVRNDEAAERLAREGIRVVQDRCLGVYVALHR